MDKASKKDIIIIRGRDVFLIPYPPGFLLRIVNLAGPGRVHLKVPKSQLYYKIPPAPSLREWITWCYLKNARELARAPLKSGSRDEKNPQNFDRSSFFFFSFSHLMEEVHLHIFHRAPRRAAGWVLCDAPRREARAAESQTALRRILLFFFVCCLLSLFYSDSARSPGPPLQLTSSLCISGFIRCTYYIVYIRQGRMLLSLLLLVADARKDPRIIVTISGTNFFPLIRAS